jgi:heme oxygenase (biliverdin-IX-beta and delta-forming)
MVATDTTDVLALLRASTRAEHDRVEACLDLLDEALTTDRLRTVLLHLSGFWTDAEAGLRDWAAAHPAAAAAVDWPRRQRAALFAADAAALGADPTAIRAPVLEPVGSTGAALGRLYVLEGSSLGGQVILRHMDRVPALAGVRLRGFGSYGAETGLMWRRFRQYVQGWVLAGGPAVDVEQAAVSTFRALEEWCAPLRRVA